MQRVLLVSGDGDLQQEIGELFVKDLEVDADMAESGEIALARIREQRYDLVIIDWNGSALGGGGVLRALRRNASFPRVLLISSDPQAESEAKTFGVQYVHKPFGPDTFLAHVVALL